MFKHCLWNIHIIFVASKSQAISFRDFQLADKADSAASLSRLWEYALFFSRLPTGKAGKSRQTATDTRDKSANASQAAFCISAKVVNAVKGALQIN